MRDGKYLTEMDGVKYIASIPKDEIIVSMCAVGDCLFVASDRHLYKLVDERRLEIQPLEIEPTTR